MTGSSRRHWRATNAALLGIVLSGGSALAQTMTTPLVDVTTEPAAAPISGSPGSGPDGATGRPAGYRCNQMTWGTACADFWQFGTFTTYPGSTGKNAPGSSGQLEIDNSNDTVLTAAPSGTPSAGTYTIVVTQLASAMKQSSTSDSGLQQSSVLNSGYSFDLKIATPTGTLPTVTMAAGTTLAQLKTEIETQLGAGYTVIFETVNLTGPPATSTQVITVTGPMGAGHDYSIVTDARDVNGALTNAEVAGVGFQPPQPTSFVDPETNQTVTVIPPGHQSQDAQYTINGTLYTSATNFVSNGDFNYTLLDDGTTTLTVIPISGIIPNGANGVAGANASNATQNINVTSIVLPGTAVTLARTGGQGGTAQIGGTGGAGGTGGSAVVGTLTQILFPVPFPPIPKTTAYSAQGGRGGTGGQGGTGGIGGGGGLGGNVSLQLNADSANVGTLSSLRSTGGQGGAGGQGGSGGLGGHGADAVSGVHNTDLLGWAVVVGDSNVGGTGGLGGYGGAGGVGGDGGAVTLQSTIITAQAVNGHILLSEGGQGGTGGQGGSGGKGGFGGHGTAATDFISKTNAGDGADGGTGGNGLTGGQGSTGGSGGAVSAFIGPGDLIVTQAGITATSRGGRGGTGGQGGTGGAGGTGGNGGGAGNNSTLFIVSDAGDGGDAGNGGDGGAGGAGGNGGAVTVTTEASGSIIAGTSAIVAQSFGGIGGAGGQGGTGGAGGVGGLPGWHVDSIPTATPGYGGNDSVAGSAGLGGDGGNGGAGGDGGLGGSGGHVTVNNAQRLATTGASYSSAILAQSLGAIGGSGGTFGGAGDSGLGGAGGTRCYLDVNLGDYNCVTWAHAPSGSSGVAGTTIGNASLIGGAGGQVDVNNTGNITTVGSRSDAITALSIGGVYGLSGYRAQDAFWDGLPAGTQFSGASVVSVNNSGSLRTTGANSAAIMALSYARGQNSGDVSVLTTGPIETSGSSAHAIIAESRVYSDPAAESADAGSVSIGNGANIVTSGAGAHAIFARSASPIGLAQNVNVENSDATVACTASGCAAIYLESFGSSGSGNISLFNNQVISGGLGGKAIELVSGRDNLIVNDQGAKPAGSTMIGASGGIYDTAISGTTGNDRIENRNGALITGNIRLGSGNNSLLNDTGSTYISGTTIDLGGGTFTNNAFFSPGGVSNIMSASNANGTTSINGNYVQGASGQYVVNIGFQTGADAADFTDFVSVSGTAVLNGLVTLEPTVGAGKFGNFHIPILSAAGGITNTGIAINPLFESGTPSTTAVFSASLEVSGDTLFVNYAIDYSPPGLTPNASNYGNAVNNIQAAGVPSFQIIANQLLRIPTLAELQRAYDSLTGEGIAASQQATLGARAQFTSSLLSGADSLAFCNERDPRVVDECRRKTRTWFEAKYLDGHQNGNRNTASTEQTVSSASGGYEARINSNSLIGTAFDINDVSFSVLSRWTHGSTTGGSAAAYGMAWSDIGFYGKALVSGGGFGNDTDRQALGRHVSGDYNAYAVGSAAEIGYRQQFNGFAVSPFVAYQFDRLIQPSWQEDEPVYGNYYHREVVDSHGLLAGLRFDAAAVLDDQAWIRVFARVAYMHEFNSERALTVESLAARGFSWEVNGLEAPEDSVQIDFGFHSRISEGVDMTFKGSYNGYSDGSQRSGSISASFKF